MFYCKAKRWTFGFTSSKTAAEHLCGKRQKQNITGKKNTTQFDWRWMTNMENNIQGTHYTKLLILNVS